MTTQDQRSAAIRSATTRRPSGGLGLRASRRFTTAKASGEAGSTRVHPGSGDGAGDFADGLAHIELGNVGLGTFGQSALGHQAAGGDEVGGAKQTRELHPGVQMFCGGVLGKLRGAHAQLVGDGVRVVAEDRVEVVLDDAAAQRTYRQPRSRR